jgi:Flp pilus assembly protein TadD
MAAVAKLPRTEHGELAERVWAIAGCLTADNGDPKEAETYLQQAERLRRNDPLISLGRGAIAIRQERLSDAVDALIPATEQSPTSVEAWRHLGKAYLLGAETELAVAALRRAVLLAPKDPMIHADLAQALLQLKQFPEAETEYRTVSALLPNDPYYSTLPVRVLAFSARTEAEYARASQALQEILSRTPEDDGLRADLAGLHMRFIRFDLARQELETILNRNPVISGDCWYNLYTVYKKLGDKSSQEGARVRMQQLIELKQESVRLFEQAQLHPNDAHVFLQLSNVLLGLREMKKSYAALMRAATLAPEDPEISATMARAQAYIRARQGAAPQDGTGAQPQ